MKYGYVVSGGAFDEVVVRTGTVRASNATEAAVAASKIHAGRRMLWHKVFGRMLRQEPPLSQIQDACAPKQRLAVQGQYLYAYGLLDDGHAERVWIGEGRTGAEVRELLPIAHQERKERKMDEAIMEDELENHRPMSRSVRHINDIRRR